MPKSEPKTMRFESDVEAYINQFDGDNFSQKFHIMVRWFINSEDEKKKKLAVLDRDIEIKEKRIKELNDFLYDVGWIEREFQSLDRSIKNTKRYFDNFLDLPQYKDMMRVIQKTG